VLVVSHDREFLNNIVTQTLAFEGDGIVKEYVGGYDDWERQRKKPEPVVKVPVSVKKEPADPTPQQGPRKLSFKENRELESLPAQIEQLEAELDQINTQLSDPTFYGKTGFVVTAKKRGTEIGSALETMYERWQELEQRPR
jgi:ABC transport system ATP-binding/permease protein